MNSIVDDLLNIHRIITRGLNVSVRKYDEYLGRKGMTTAEAKGLSMYTSALRWVIHAHHLTEDEIVYPIFKDRIEAPYDQLMNDHKAVTGILDKLKKSLPVKSAGDAELISRLLGELKMMWGPHIRIEEEAFTANNVQALISMEEQVKLKKEFSEHGRKNSGPAKLALPFMIYNLDGKERKDFSMMLPWIVRKVFVPVVWKEKWKPMKPYLLI
jgi:hypothetical protein